MNNFKITRLPVGQLESNCYIYQITQNEAIIVDPGDDAEYIIQKLLDANLKPVATIATHGHYDHILAGFTLQAAYNTPFYIHKNDDFLLTRMRETAIHFGEVDPGPPPIPTYIDKETTIKIPGVIINIFPVPGHTPGSVAFYDKDRQVVFVGDLLFADGSIGEVSHKYSDRAKTKESIKKILKLPTDTIVYSGHGEEATIRALREQFEWALK